MSVSRRASRSTPAVIPLEPSRRRPRRRGALECGVVLAILFALAIGAATLAFWYYAASTGWLSLTESALYFMRNAGLVALFVGGLALFVAIGSYQRAILPTAGLLEAANRVTAGEYELEVEEKGPRELRSLTRAFNEMANALKTREELRRRLLADVARALQSARPEDPRYGRLVRDWCQMMLTENSELVLHPERSDIGGLIRDVLSALHPLAAERNVSMRATLPPKGISASVDADTFANMLSRLVVHAIARLDRYGEIELDVSEEGDPPGLRLSVADNAHSPLPQEMAMLFDVYRASNTVGSGLELPLARILVNAQGGQISAQCGEEAGLTVTVVLPYESDPA